MDFTKIIAFVEQEREAQKIKKVSLCGKCDISPQYYDLLIKGQSKPNYEVINNLLQAIGYDFAIIKTI